MIEADDIGGTHVKYLYHLRRVHGRPSSLARSVAYDELLYLDALALTRHCLENTGYKPFRIWW